MSPVSPEIFEPSEAVPALAVRMRHAQYTSRLRLLELGLTFEAIMKRSPRKLATRLAALLLLTAPVAAFAGDHMIPAGSLVQCTVSEPKLSSKTTAVGDPVLCQVSHVELYGRSVFPAGSYLVGRFEDYKDPGHFYGKGWMELKFDRMVIQPDTVIPMDAKVVYVPKYPVDRDGKIHGKGHPVRDTVEWMIPVLWPIDLINLPRRGPRPVLKEETRLTLKIMDDLVVPDFQQTPHDAYGFAQRSYVAPPPPPVPEPAPQPVTYNTYVTPPPAPMPVYLPAPPPTVLVMRGGYGFLATRYWFDGYGAVRYTSLNGAPYVLPMQQLDIASTVEANRRRGVAFRVPAPGY